MKTACATLLASIVFAGSAGAATPLDGTFNGSYSCPPYQGQTNVVLSFTVTGARAKLIEVIYHATSSKYKFDSSVVEYTGNYNASTRKFGLLNPQTVGDEPSGWTYSKTMNGTVSANGLDVTILKDQSSPSCTNIYAKRVPATGSLIQ